MIKWCGMEHCNPCPYCEAKIEAMDDAFESLSSYLQEDGSLRVPAWFINKSEFLSKWASRVFGVKVGTEQL